MKRILLALLMLFPSLLEGQTPNFALNDASTYPAERTYLNIGVDNYYNTYLSKNLIKVNPSMQPQLVRQIEHCQSGSTTSCVTGAQYGDFSGVAANYYVGWTVYVACHGGQGSQPGTCAGGAQGQTTTVTSNSANSGSSTTINFTALSASIGAFDTIWLIKPSTITTPSAQFTWPDFGWQPSTTGSGTATIDTTSADFPPTLDGFANVSQVVELTVPTSGSTSQLLTYFDTGTGPNYFFNGAYHHCVNVKVKSGSGTLTFAGNRPSGVSWSSGVAVSSSSWTNVCAPFTGSETSSVPSGSVTITMTLSTTSAVDIVVYGGSLTADADNNPTAFTNKTISNIQLLNPGGLRFNDSGTVMGQSVLNWITPGSMRRMSYYIDAYNGASGQGLSLHEFLTLCQYLNIVPIITAPVTFSSTDWQNLVEYLGGSSSTTYGGYRATLGQTTPWTSVFSKIPIEIDNEAWNSSLGQGKFAFPLYSVSSTSYWNYVVPAVNACGAIKTAPSYNSVIKCAVSVQTANSSTTGYFTTVDATNHYVDRVNANEYGQFNVTTCTNPTMWTSSWVEALNAVTSNDGLGINATQSAKGSWMNIFVYEYANSTDGGSCTQANLTGYPEGQGYGITNALMPRVMQKAGFGTEQAIWQMYQPTTNITTSAGGPFPINEWGVFTGPGGAYNNLRAMGYGLKIANDCVSTGNTGYSVTPTNITTFNFTAANGVNSTSNVPTLNAFAFETGSSRCLLVQNIDPNNSYSFTASGTNAPSGSITRNLFTASALTASNEGANTSPTVTISTTTISSGTYTIPAASSVALIWTASTTLSPPTFTPPAGTYIGTQLITLAGPSGATICYTTNGTTPAATTPGTCSTGSTYTTGFPISIATTVQAISTQSGQTNSTVASASYAFTPTTWIIRPDGGTRYSANEPTGRCNGHSDAPDPGSGVNQPCGWKDYRSLFYDGSYTGGSATFPAVGYAFAGGDTIIVRGSIGTPQTYRVGWSNNSSALDSASGLYTGIAGDPYDSGLGTFPAGTSGQHTKLLGENYAACTIGSAKTQLHGGFGANIVLDLRSTSYVDVACLDITDFSSCGQSGQVNSCNTTVGSLSDYASNGIQTNNTTTNVTLTDVNIHGLAKNGQLGPTGTGWVDTRVNWTGNASSGRNLDAGDSTTGTGTFLSQNFAVIGNGCAEEYPVVDSFPFQDCTDDNGGGYGDGIGTATVTSSPAWTMHFDQGIVAYNTQDGIDALHIRGTGSNVTVTRTLDYGNMGQQIKIGGASATAINNLLVGNCNALRNAIPGFPSGYNTHLTDFCRASDEGILLSVGKGTTLTYQFNTLFSANQTGIELTCDTTAGACDSTSLIDFRNNIFVGFQNNTTNGYPGGGSGNFSNPINNDSGINPFTNTGSVFAYNITNNPASSWTCPNTTYAEANAICTSALLTDMSWHIYGYGNMTPLSTSPAISSGVTISGVTVDYNGTARTSPPTRGAIQGTSTSNTGPTITNTTISGGVIIK